MQVINGNKRMIGVGLSYLIGIILVIGLCLFIYQFLQLSFTFSLTIDALKPKAPAVTQTQIVVDPPISAIKPKPIAIAPILDTNIYPTTYLIQQGDTLTKISRDTFYSVDELAEFNHIQNVNLIYANSILRIPQKKPN